jgi:hypothetical protein
VGQVLDVIGISDFKPNRGSEVLGRVYLDAWLPETSAEAGQEPIAQSDAADTAAGAETEVAVLRAQLAEAEARKQGLAMELLAVDRITARLAAAVGDADDALGDELRDRQGIAERLIGAVVVAVRDLTGYGDDEEEDPVCTGCGSQHCTGCEAVSAGDPARCLPGGGVR